MQTSGIGPFVTQAFEFADVLGEAPRLIKVADADAHEGPVYVANEDALYFTSLPRVVDVPTPGSRTVAVRRVQLKGEEFPRLPHDVSTVREPANMANGMVLDQDGCLLVCEQGTRFEHGRISRLDPRTGCTETIVDAWQGLRLNSPNDVVQKRDGSIWFTDPSYGFLQGFKDQPQVGDYVYRFDPASGQVTIVADGLDKPNGLAFSPDESVLYVGDSGAIHGPDDYSAQRPHHVLTFDVREGRHLWNQRLFAVIAPGFPDGIKVDRSGRVYVSSFSGVQVFSPAGDPLGKIHLPGAVNFTFGGAKGNLLFITADSAIWVAMLQAVGG